MQVGYGIHYHTNHELGRVALSQVDRGKEGRIDAEHARILEKPLEALERVGRRGGGASLELTRVLHRVNNEAPELVQEFLAKLDRQRRHFSRTLENMTSVGEEPLSSQPCAQAKLMRQAFG